MYGLDLNNDGVIDVTLSVGYEGIPCVGGGFGSLAIAEETPAVGNGAEGAPAALEEGETIGPSQTYHAQEGVLKAYYSCSRDQSGAFGSEERYLGLMFRIHGETHYGWALLSVIANGSEASTTVTGYAYETSPGTPIYAGQTTGAEDSSALRPEAYPKDSARGRMMKTTIRYGIPGKRPSRFFRKVEAAEIAKHMNTPSDIKAQVKNPLEFLRQKRLLQGTDSASDSAFLGLAKALKPDPEKPS